MKILAKGYYQARNSLNPSLITFHYLEPDSDGKLWVWDVPNPQAINPTHKRKRMPTDDLLNRLGPIEGGIGDKALLIGSKAAKLEERSEKELSNEGEFMLKAADADAEMDLKMEHFINKVRNE